jgi:hypothetical protein
MNTLISQGLASYLPLLHRASDTQSRMVDGWNFSTLQWIKTMAIWLLGIEKHSTMLFTAQALVARTGGDPTHVMDGARETYLSLSRTERVKDTESNNVGKALLKAS